MDELAPNINVEDDLFSFETDHLALRGNEDYCEVLKTLVILAAQREKALKDYKTVSELRTEALQDPIGILEKIQNGTDLGVPPLLELAKLPNIDFQKYKVKVSESELRDIYSDDGTQSQPEKTDMCKSNSLNNGAWTPEEQKRLEELLKVYPPEPIEMRRFQKIANALGTRTVYQVASRLQKYFLKLYKAGLPIPGRIPKCAEKYKRSGMHKHQRHNHYLWKPTTFFPGLSVPVQMEDMKNIPGPSETYVSSPTENYLLKNGYNEDSCKSNDSENEFDFQLKLLKKVREVKTLEMSADYMPFSHVGFKCDYCEESPISGFRWHCTVCPESIDFCTDCVVSQMYTDDHHSFHHWLVAYRNESFLFEEEEEEDEFLNPQMSNQQYEKQIQEEMECREFEAVSSDKDDISDEQ